MTGAVTRSIRHLAVIGGGTAGWLAASLIQAARNRRNDGPDLAITLVESPNVPIIGVGEATTLSIVSALAMLKVSEVDFLQRCDASIKAAVRFVDWDRAPNGAPLSYYHPFEAPEPIYGFSPAYHYLKRSRARPGAGIDRVMATAPALLDRGLAPRTAETADFDGLAPYAYHLDAVLFAEFLRDYATALGVRHLRDDLVGIERDERGLVTQLRLATQGALDVDFVIDCTGFQGLVVGKMLGEPFVPYGEHLMCDRALALQLPHPEGAALKPYTTARALGAGWSWEVPLYSRRGTGYVYSSRFQGESEAAEEFLAFLGPAAKGATPRLIRMNIGRLRRSWVGNCLAVGLAGGFIEPLESTSIHFIQMAVRWFIDSFPDRDVNPALAENYNRLVEALYEEIRDFVVLHYRLSNRDDTAFWRAARSELALPDRLAAKLARWRTKLPSVLDVTNRLSLFSEWAYTYVLFGKNFYGVGASLPIEDAIGEQDYDAFLRETVRRQEDALARAPDHRALLTRLRAQPVAAWYRPEPLAATAAEAAIA